MKPHGQHVYFVVKPTTEDGPDQGGGMDAAVRACRKKGLRFLNATPLPSGRFEVKAMAPAEVAS